MIALEPFNQEDISRLIHWINTKDELYTFAGNIFSFPLDEKQLKNYIKHPKHIPFKVILKSTKEVIGHCEINNTQKHPRLSRILIGDKNHRGKGLSKHILIALLNQVDKPKEVDLNVYDWNKPAIATYKNFGFKIRPEQSVNTTFNNKPCVILNMVLKFQ